MLKAIVTMYVIKTCLLLAISKIICTCHTCTDCSKNIVQAMLGDYSLF